MTVTDHDNDRLVAPGDLRAAVGLLTRLPITVDPAVVAKRGAASAWAYPVAGFLVAVLCAFFGAVLLWMDVPIALTSALIVGCGAFVTGAMHEDGLADSVDGLWGGWDRARRLEIMKDSRTGAYGVIALIISLLLRWQAVALVIGAGLMWPALIAAAVISRTAMVVVMTLLPNARAGGLSQSVGRPPARAAWLACGIGALAAMLLGTWAITIVIVAGLSGLIVATIARAKIGGQTGDILGATQQIVETAVLISVTALAA